MLWITTQILFEQIKEPQRTAKILSRNKVSLRFARCVSRTPSVYGKHTLSFFVALYGLASRMFSINLLHFSPFCRSNLITSSAPDKSVIFLLLSNVPISFIDEFSQLFSFLFSIDSHRSKTVSFLVQLKLGETRDNSVYRTAKVTQTSPNGIHET